MNLSTKLDDASLNSGNPAAVSAQNSIRMLAGLNHPALHVGSEMEFPRNMGLHEVFERTVLESPSRIAVVFDRQRITYDQLNRWANQLAHRLLQQGVGPGSVIVSIPSAQSR